MDAELAMRLGTGGKVHVDLASLPDGKFYEDRYRGYLDVFDRIAHMPAHMQVTVANAPWSWVPLLLHLKAVCVTPRAVFKHCTMVQAVLNNTGSEVLRANTSDPLVYVDLDRTALEVLVSFRPETADLLWKIDVQWAADIEAGRIRTYDDDEREFIVTTNGSFHRREVLDFMKVLQDYTPRKKKALLVPCAADKPYPAPMHRACLNLMPNDFYMLNATGVVGLVPQDMWGIAPWYDSGIPNQHRLFETVRDFFAEHHHDRIVCYMDFYAPTVYQALLLLGYEDVTNEAGESMANALGNTVEFVLEVKEYPDYVDLMDASRLKELELVLARE